MPILACSETLPQSTEYWGGGVLGACDDGDVVVREDCDPAGGVGGAGRADGLCFSVLEKGVYVLRDCVERPLEVLARGHSKRKCKH